ncbi:Holliday junction branch migration DNA helicase RuvB [Candidatus Gracilibacteria bacterium]|nr:Holliday junction branch migration DNA helicase RuvB [Candidatus Gracilibacteria bacterium]
MVAPVQQPSDTTGSTNILRPKTFDNYVGQDHIKKHLGVSLASAKMQKRSLEHILFYGPPGLGKTTLANIISVEMETSLKSTSGPAIEKQSDLVSILSNLQENDILFIDEIHRLRPQVEEILYTAMEDFEIDIMVGSGTGAQSVKLALKPFTLVGATTKLSALSSPLRDRFGNVLKLDFYEVEDIETILKRNSEVLETQLSDQTIHALALRSRGTPRIANRLLKIIRDYMVVGKEVSDPKVLEEIFHDIGVDEKGLDYLDRKYLSLLSGTFAGGPVGLNTLASALGEEESTLEQVVEPYLLQIGFLERTPRGRKTTLFSSEYMNSL